MSLFLPARSNHHRSGRHSHCWQLSRSPSIPPSSDFFPTNGIKQRLSTIKLHWKMTFLKAKLTTIVLKLARKTWKTMMTTIRMIRMSFKLTRRSERSPQHLLMRTKKWWVYTNQSIRIMVLEHWKFFWVKYHKRLEEWKEMSHCHFYASKCESHFTFKINITLLMTVKKYFCVIMDIDWYLKIYGSRCGDSRRKTSRFLFIKVCWCHWKPGVWYRQI